MASPESEGTFKVTDRRRRSDEETSHPGPAPSAERPAAAAERNLVGLFMMLGSSALMALGEAPEPATGQRRRDLPAAAEIIDVLLLLRDKTEGRRSADESQVLDELLYDLQLRYVRATKSS
jgi:hypothetical protein